MLFFNLFFGSIGSKSRANFFTTQQRSPKALVYGTIAVQVVVAPHSHIIGKSIRELRFRTKYDAAIVAVQRRVSSAARVNCETRHFFLIPCSYANTHRMHYIPPAGRALETKDWRNCAERGGRAAARHRCVCLLQPWFLVHIFGSCVRAGLLFTSNPQARIFWKTTGKTRPLLSWARWRKARPLRLARCGWDWGCSLLWLPPRCVCGGLDLNVSFEIVQLLIWTDVIPILLFKEQS